MSHYKHLTLSEREMLLYFLTKGFSLTAIAGKLGRNKSTISRELKRNTGKSMYLPVEAQEKYHQRRRSCKPSKKLDTPLIYDYLFMTM